MINPRNKTVRSQLIKDIKDIRDCANKLEIFGFKIDDESIGVLDKKSIINKFNDTLREFHTIITANL